MEMRGIEPRTSRMQSERSTMVFRLHSRFKARTPKRAQLQNHLVLAFPPLLSSVQDGISGEARSCGESYGSDWIQRSGDSGKVAYMDRSLFHKLLLDDSDEDEIIEEVVMETSQHKRRCYIRRNRLVGHGRLFLDYFAPTPIYPPSLFRRRF
ncbi:hypothetical protein CMV_003254 [Castanea mollissima]|uniref:Uncharacterized protein n=1 Tax=Castanea mollissima TaxID=60419 RepID=A0A8J4VVD2_9ROSI|nr:hypothetical protein CMV_003254 [Castanea mollissima]